MSSRIFLVTSTARHILSSGHCFFLAVDCMMAVRKDWGLKNPASHTVAGSTKSVDQTSSSWKVNQQSPLGGWRVCCELQNTVTELMLCCA